MTETRRRTELRATGPLPGGETPPIVVVGAGLAGLNCGAEPIAALRRTLVLEAAARAVLEDLVRQAWAPR